MTNLDKAISCQGDYYCLIECCGMTAHFLNSKNLEYEVTKGEKVFYVPDGEQLKVVVYYAAKHPNPAPLT